MLCPFLLAVDCSVIQLLCLHRMVVLSEVWSQWRDKHRKYERESNTRNQNMFFDIFTCKQIDGLRIRVKEEWLRASSYIATRSCPAHFECGPVEVPHEPQHRSNKLQGS